MRKTSGIRINALSDGLQLEKAMNEGGQMFTLDPSNDQIVTRVKDGKVLGGVIYSGWTGYGGSVELHICGIDPHWISRDLIYVCFDYPFNQLRVKKIWGRVPASNTTALDLDRKFGMVEEHRLKDVFPDGDLIILSMYRAQCKWLALGPRPVALI